jgi:phosphoribosylformylglycinamidine synthase
LSPAPYFNAEEEFQLQTALYDFIRTGKLVSAHDCSDGGLFITLLEAGLVNHLGFNINTPGHIRKDAFLFGEGQGRVVVSINPENREFFENFFKQRNIPFLQIGQTQENLLEIDHENWGDIADWKKIYEDTLPSILD